MKNWPEFNDIKNIVLIRILSTLNWKLVLHEEFISILKTDFSVVRYYEA